MIEAIETRGLLHSMIQKQIEEYAAEHAKGRQVLQETEQRITQIRARLVWIEGGVDALEKLQKALPVTPDAPPEEGEIPVEGSQGEAGGVE